MASALTRRSCPSEGPHIARIHTRCHVLSGFLVGASLAPSVLSGGLNVCFGGHELPSESQIDRRTRRQQVAPLGRLRRCSDSVSSLRYLRRPQRVDPRPAFDPEETSV